MRFGPWADACLIRRWTRCPCHRPRARKRWTTTIDRRRRAHRSDLLTARRLVPKFTTRAT